MPTYTIGELATKHGLTLRALRFYETKHKLLAPQREGPGEHAKRVYSENDTLRLDEIVRGTRLGFGLAKIAELLEDGPMGPWLAITPEVAAKQLAHMRGRLDEVAGAVAELEKLVPPKHPAGSLSR